MAQEYWQKGAEFGYNKALEEATHNYNAIAKEIIKGLLNIKKIVTDDKDYEVLAKAEQFLKESE